MGFGGSCHTSACLSFLTYKMGIMVVPAGVTVIIKLHDVCKALSTLPGTQGDKEMNVSVAIITSVLSHQWAELGTTESILLASNLAIISRWFFFFKPRL